MTFEEMMGKEFEFFGVDGNTFKLGEKVFEALEEIDEELEYKIDERSFLGSVEEVKESTGLNFATIPVAVVRVVRIETAPGDLRNDFDGYHLVDVSDGHVWLKLGTDGARYAQYPYFEFDYDPKKP